MKIVQLLNQPRDIPLALLLQKTCPEKIHNVIVNAKADDQFGWRKRKSLEQCLTDEDTADAMHLLNNPVNCSKLSSLMNEIKGADVCISRGREYFIIKPPAKSIVAMCFNRCYFGRFLDVWPHYGSSLKVMMFSPAWMSKEYCKTFEMNNHINGGKHTYEYAREFKEHYRYGNPFEYYYEYLKGRGKEQVKKDLGLPTDRPIAFLSFRKAEDLFTIYRDNDHYMDVVTKMLKEFKAKGYYIISRRRMGKHDRIGCKVHKSPDLSRFHEVESMIDVEMNGTTRFPGEIWEGLFASDILLLADISGIAYIEAGLMRCPVYMPHQGSIRNEEQLCPAISNMFRSGLMMNTYDHDSIAKWHESIEIFLSRWYQPGGIKKFWQEALR